MIRVSIFFIKKAPFVLSDYTQVPSLIYGAIALIVLIIALVYTFRKPKSEMAYVAPEILLPPHVVALSDLDRIKEEKLWLQGRYKEFYTQLTDVLRAYMSRRFGFSAMEMTTWEILSMLKNQPEASAFYQSMKDLLELSDFVKFAKFTASEEENASALPVAVRFVTSTYQTEVEEETGVQADDEKGGE